MAAGLGEGHCWGLLGKAQAIETFREIVSKGENLENLVGAVLKPLLVIPVCPTLAGFKVV